MMMTFEEFEKKSQAEQYKAFLDAAEESKKDDTPYLAVADNEINILGDPNKTEVVKHDYKVDFAFPNTKENKDALKASGIDIKLETPNYIRVQKEFKDVYLVARRATDVIEAFTRVQAFINKVTVIDESGNFEVNIRSDEELLDIMSSLNREMEDAIYEAVGKFFRLSDYETDCMILPSVIFNVMEIAVNNPDLMNGSEVFFDLLRGNN